MFFFPLYISFLLKRRRKKNINRRLTGCKDKNNNSKPRQATEKKKSTTTHFHQHSSTAQCVAKQTDCLKQNKRRYLCAGNTRCKTCAFSIIFKPFRFMLHFKFQRWNFRRNFWNFVVVLGLNQLKSTSFCDKANSIDIFINPFRCPSKVLK